MARTTPLADEHERAGAKWVDFAGWRMPISYGSQLDEHHAVRQRAGLFDVSHMAVVDITGPHARDFLRRALANDVAKVDADGKAIYSCMLNTRGGVVDDLIIYHVEGDWYRAVVNAATADKDLAWLAGQASEYDVAVEHRGELSIVAVQGPAARELVADQLDSELAERALTLKPFEVAASGDWSVGRTGYTGEDGFEIVLPAEAVVAFWRALVDAAATPVGLGARDTLRLEAGLNLYGQDMDEDHSPLVSGLGWTVAFAPAERDFVGRAALEAARADGVTETLIGLVLRGRGVLRSGAGVRRVGDERYPDPAASDLPGRVTSGSYAPTLARSIALARGPADWCDNTLEAGVRGRWQPARVVSYPFVRRGKIRVPLD